jgi:carotenoid cleavage dioxygenase
MNAWRDGDNVILDVCRLPKVFDGTGLLPQSFLHRWTINTAGKSLTFKDEQRSDRTADLPSIDMRYTGRAYRDGWRMSVHPADNTLDLAGVTHIDARTGAETSWDPGEQYASGEWLFVPTGDGEGNGVLLSFVHDKSADTSELVVLNARDIAAGPLARVALPQRVPYGFHATWVPAQEI